MLTPKERSECYGKRFPNHPPISYNDRWLCGAWYFFRSKAGKIYGSYPNQYLKRIYALFPDCSDILHLCSGGLEKEEKGIKFDINPEMEPDVCGDIRNIKDYFDEDSFDLILADPPYGEKDFAIYGQKPFNKGNVMRDIFDIVKPKGFVVWLDTILPKWKGKQWQLMGMIAFAQGPGMRGRLISIFQSRKGEVND